MRFIPAEELQPTPEQLHDTGELDGVPLRTLADVKRDRRKQLTAIASLLSPTFVTRPKYRQRNRAIVSDRGDHWRTQVGAAETLGITPGAVYQRAVTEREGRRRPPRAGLDVRLWFEDEAPEWVLKRVRARRLIGACRLSSPAAAGAAQ